MVVDDKLKIQEFENDRKDFSSYGLDVINFISRKYRENPNFKCDYRDASGEYYIKPQHFSIGEDLIFKKKQSAGEIPAEVILSYAYNYLGIPAPVAYPYFVSHYKKSKGHVVVPDGVITKDITQAYPNAVKRKDPECHTFKGLYTSDKCKDISSEGKLDRVKETIASIAFNNKDAGFENSFWLKDNSGKFFGIVSIDHGYAGRDSAYCGDKQSMINSLYLIGEHGYNGMYYWEEDRKTVIYFLKKLLAGSSVDGVQFSDKEIKEINNLIEAIAKQDFKQISSDYADRYSYKCSPRYLQSLEWSREDFCKEFGK